MQVRNLLIAAGATLAGLTAIVAAPTAASAQEYRYAPAYRTYDNHRDYGRYDARRVWEQRRLAELRREEMRREYLRHHRHAGYEYGYRF